MYGTFGEFVQDEQLGEDDLILTNEYIYEPYMAQYGLKCGICFQEKYGAGEPTDVMIEAIAADVKLSGFKRIIAVGGGTIIDIAKILSLKGFSSVDEVYSGETLIKGKNLDEALELTNKAVVEALDGLPARKIHCSVLAEDAIKAALVDYYTKTGREMPESLVGFEPHED